MEKRFNGNAIYQPTGKAAEYAPWACNFYTGCSNNCLYCYCKRGVMSHVWTPYPNLKKIFKNETHAYEVFVRELERNLDVLRKTGLFFSFTTDPMLPDTRILTMLAVTECIHRQVPVQILTKCADFIVPCHLDTLNDDLKKYVAVGFTLTGCDEMEPNAPGNYDRVRTMLELHRLGFKTFASLEPVVKPHCSLAVLNVISGWCDLIKVGLLSGKRKYGEGELEALYEIMLNDTRGSRFYLKNSFVEALDIDRRKLPSHFVNSDYNLFSHDEG